MKLGKLFASATAVALAVSGLAVTAASADQNIVETNPGDYNYIYVSADDIKPNNDEYVGWHEEVEPAPIPPNYVPDTWGKSIQGLKVSAKSQLIYGYEEGNRPQNSLLQILDAETGGFYIHSPSSTNSEGSRIQVQVPVFYYPEGDRSADPQFTTLRTPLDDLGYATAEAPWVSSQPVKDVPADTGQDLNVILEAMEDYEVLGHGFTVDGSTEGLSFTIAEVRFNGHFTTFEKKWFPGEAEEAELTDDNRGSVLVPDEALVGSEIEVTAPVEKDAYVTTYLFSDPFTLNPVGDVDENGQYTVMLPENTLGQHKVAIYDIEDDLIGWDDINIVASEEGSGEDDDSSGGAGDSEEDNAVAITPADSEEAPANTEELAATGSESGLAGFIAAAIAAAGALALGVSVLRRRES